MQIPKRCAPGILKRVQYKGVLTKTCSNKTARLRIHIDAMDVAESSSGYGIGGIIELDSMPNFDAHYCIELLDGDLRLTGSALNISDERAPIAPVESAYDAHTHNPLGRVFQIGLRYAL